VAPAAADGIGPAINQPDRLGLAELAG